MKFKNLILISITAFATILSSFSNQGKNYEIEETINDSTSNYLALYGKYVFTREKCSNCHTLNQSENNNLISLDGMRDKYPNSWHYLHFEEPLQLIYDSKMPPFNYLKNNIINRDTFQMISKKNDKTSWVLLNKQADTIVTSLKQVEIKLSKKNELLALIAYLNTITPSKELMAKASLERVEALIQIKKWESLIADTNNIIYETIQKKESIEKGMSLFKSICSPCHGDSGGGIIGPNLTDDYWLHGGKVQNLVNTIVNGVPEKGMMSWKFQLEPIEVGQVVAYLKFIKGTNPQNAKMQQGKKE